MNTTNTINQSLFDLIETFDNAARIPALRAIVHYTMAKCIGAIRQYMREQARNTRNENEPQIDLDQRNEFDEAARRDTEDTYHAAFDAKLAPSPSPLNEANLLHAVYDWANSELQTLITSQWDAPLTIEQMLQFMTERAPKLDPVLAQALADAAKTDIKTIERMHELQSQREREQLIEATPEIILTFKGFGENGYPNAIDELPKVVQHQIGVKVVEALSKAREQVLNRVLRTRRINELGSVPILEDAAKQVSRWVEQFEHRYSDEIREAIDAGRNLRTLEDVTTI
ncbi:MAG: hypothetical protein KatS3mg015_2640 [Fimbriimonadales bacterium]|nr:MAG: hypothetical protein KatS3mg015_2640 [Fimbriimonadales bacterium]